MSLAMLSLQSCAQSHERSELARKITATAGLKLPGEWSLLDFGDALQFILAEFPYQDYRARIPSGDASTERVLSVRRRIHAFMAAFPAVPDMPETDDERAILDLQNKIIARVNLMAERIDIGLPPQPFDVAPSSPFHGITDWRGSEWFNLLMRSMPLLDTILAKMLPTEDEIKAARRHGKITAKHRKVIDGAREAARQACRDGEISEREKTRFWNEMAGPVTRARSWPERQARGWEGWAPVVDSRAARFVGPRIRPPGVQRSNVLRAGSRYGG